MNILGEGFRNLVREQTQERVLVRCSFNWPYSSRSYAFLSANFVM